MRTESNTFVHLRLWTLLAAGLFQVHAVAALRIVEQGEARTPVLLAPGVSPEARRAVARMTRYIQRISGARLTVLEEAPDPPPAQAIWIGDHPVFPALVPELDLDFQEPEEILIAANDRHLVIAGRDRSVDGQIIEEGTANAVYEFIEQHLGVRQLWPGELGEDLPLRETIAFAPFSYRFHPPFRTRHLYPRQPPDWHRFHRILLYSQPFAAGHAFNDWWERYGESHPDYFALRADGTRTPHAGRGMYAKLCVSNPDVATQWLDDAEATLRAHPAQTMISASPTDGPGFCVCEQCRAWDAPEAPEGMLTDRYVRFWNRLARGLKERFPERHIELGVLAYSAYSAPPLRETLEGNITVYHVGHFPLTTETARSEQKAHWLAWSRMASRMVYRPNLWYWGGGVWGMPEVALRQTIEDFRFLAQNGCTGIIVDTMRHHYATQGPQYYLLAQLAWNPLQDGQAVLDDYYRRAYGPAADVMAGYWRHLEAARETLMAAPDFKLGAANRYALVELLTRIYDADFLQAADVRLRRAETLAAESALYRRRIAFAAAGLEHVRLMMRAAKAMTRVRESLGLTAGETREFAIRQTLGRIREGLAGDPEVLRDARDAWAAVERNASEREAWGISLGGLRTVMQGGYMGALQLHFGPLPDDLEAAVRELEQNQPGLPTSHPEGVEIY